MALEIFRLFGSIFVDNEKANESIKKTDEKAQGVGQSLLGAVGNAAKFGAGLAAAAGAGATALVGIATKAADAASAIDDSAQRAGMTAESFQKYAYAAKMSGIETGTLEKMMVKQQKAFADAKEGSKSMGEAYGRLGIDIESIGSSSEAFDQVMAKLAGMTDETERNALANDIFGKSYADLSPLLNEGADGLAKLKQEAVDMGTVMSDEAVAAGAELGDNIDKMKLSAENMVNTIGATLIPFANNIINWITTNMPMFQEIFQTVFSAIETGVTFVADVVQGALGGMNIKWSEVFETVKTVFMEVWAQLQAAWDALGKPIFDFIMLVVANVAGYFQAKMPEIQSFFRLMVEDLSSLWENNLKPCFEAIGSFISNVLAPAFTFVFAHVITPVIDTAFKFIKDIWSGTLKPVFTGIIDFITGVFTLDFSKAFGGLGEIVKGVFNGMISFVKVPLNNIIGVINSFIAGINKLKIPDWVPVVGGKGIDIPKIPLLAKGGTVYGSGKAIVGEAGAELLDLPAGAKVTPLTNSQGSIMGSSETLEILKLILAELKEIGSSMYDVILEALINGVKIDWNDRELARLVRKYE